MNGMQREIAEREERAASERIQKLKCEAYSEHQIAKMVNPECPICLTDFTGQNNLVASLDNCNHIFHYDCVAQWLRTRNTCPMCNQKAIN